MYIIAAWKADVLFIQNRNKTRGKAAVKRRIV